jgi:hypothetical protein
VIERTGGRRRLLAAVALSAMVALAGPAAAQAVARGIAAMPLAVVEAGGVAVPQGAGPSPPPAVRPGCRDGRDRDRPSCRSRPPAPGVYIDPDQSRDGRGVSRERVDGRVLGRVTDRPGYCYVRDSRGITVVAKCP